MAKFKTTLWRNSPQIGNTKNGRPKHLHLMPSGRQAISNAIKILELTRQDKIAIPDWSSSCVITAIGKFTTPISVSDAAAHGVPVSAVLDYEQWGWPRPIGNIINLLKSFSNPSIIFDRVDSPCFDKIKGLGIDKTKIMELWSLSKTIGLDGGGLLRYKGRWIGIENNTNDLRTLQSLSSIHDQGFAMEIAKTELKTIPPSVVSYTKNHDLYDAFYTEKITRQKNLEEIASLHGAANWENWMCEIVGSSAAPGIAPLYRGASKKLLLKISDYLKDKFSIETSIYRFDFFANPIKPSYEICLAFPIHGQLTPDLITESLKKMERQINTV